MVQGNLAFCQEKIALRYLIATLQSRHLLRQVLGSGIGWEGSFECGLICRYRSSLGGRARKPSQGDEKEIDGEVLHDSGGKDECVDLD